MHWLSIVLATQYVIFFPPTMFYHTYETQCKDNPSVVWQQQMETIYNEQYNRKHLAEKNPTHQKTVEQNIPTLFRLLPEIAD